jgi:hypothetical protein
LTRKTEERHALIDKAAELGDGSFFGRFQIFQLRQWTKALSPD